MTDITEILKYDLYNSSFEFKKYLLQIVYFMIENKLGKIDTAFLLQEKLLEDDHYLPESPITDKITNIKLLTNKKNSCYIDTVLVSLLLVPVKFITDHLLNNMSLNRKSYFLCYPVQYDILKRSLIQENLRILTSSMRNNNTTTSLFCDDLKKSFLSCGRNSDNEIKWWNDTQEDAFEFLGYLIGMFIRDVVVLEKTILGSNNLSDNSSGDEISRTKSYTSILYDIHNTEIRNDTNISDYIETISRTDFVGNNRYSKKIEKIKIIYAPYIIFSLQRIGQTEVGESFFISDNVIPDKTIIIGNNTLELNSIIIHTGGIQGGHYTSYFYLNNNWYYYDDLNSKNLYVLIGTYETLMNQRNIKQNSTLLFYKLAVVLKNGGGALKDKWRIYTKPGCGYCSDAKTLLKNNKIVYNEIIINDVNRQSILETLKKQIGNQKTFPIIFNDKKHIGGFTDLQKYLNTINNYKKS